MKPIKGKLKNKEILPGGKVYIFAASDANFNLHKWKQASGDYHVTECKSFSFTWTSVSKGIETNTDENGDIEIYDENNYSKNEK